MNDTTKAFTEAVKRMRVLQKACDGGKKELLEPAKRAEKVVDTSIEELTGEQQGKLF